MLLLIRSLPLSLALNLVPRMLEMAFQSFQISTLGLGAWQPLFHIVGYSFLTSCLLQLLLKPLPLFSKYLNKADVICVSPTNSAILLWNHVILQDNVELFAKLLHTLWLSSCKLKSSWQKLNNQVTITFTIFGSRMRIASFTRD